MFVRANQGSLFGSAFCQWDSSLPRSRPPSVWSGDPMRKHWRSDTRQEERHVEGKKTICIASHVLRMAIEVTQYVCGTIISLEQCYDGFCYVPSTRSRGSSVGKVTSLRAGRPKNFGSIYSNTGESFSSSKRPNRLWDLPTLRCNGYRSSFPEGEVVWT